jgi:hypothetical protein
MVPDLIWYFYDTVIRVFNNIQIVVENILLLKTLVNLAVENLVKGMGARLLAYVLLEKRNTFQHVIKHVLLMGVSIVGVIHH